MRYVKYGLLGLLALALATVALANRAPVTLRLLPEELSGFLGFTWMITLPLFLIVCLGIALGLLIGFVIEWAREHRYRAQARRERREKERLAREVDRLRTPGTGRGDDVLALLEDGSVPR
jgi:uncharacterized integral membrane protein